MSSQEEGGFAVPTQTQRVRKSKKQPDESLLTKEFEKSETLRIVAVVSMLAILILILAGLFAPGPRYSMAGPPPTPVEGQPFLSELESLADSKVTRNNQIEVLENGEAFYQAELEAMRQARQSINLEAYIFHKGKVTEQVLAVLTERARAGIHVNVVIDSVGSLSTQTKYFKGLQEAGGHFARYHPLRLYKWFVANNRTHREITVIDGSTAFVGGAGFADWWRYARGDKPRWRDTMVRVQGDAVGGIQGTFVENWLEASGEILDGPAYFPPLNGDPGKTTALVISSTPSSGGSTRSRILFQTLIAAAQKSIYITTPYFLPDRSMLDEMIRAKKRGISVRVIVPGKHNDHALTRSSGRSAYGGLLKAGADIYEYEASMIHAKIAIIDGVWSVVGSTNLDNRSFGINDEVNLAILDSAVAEKLTREFEEDIAHSKRITLDEWEHRSVFERMLEWIGWILERQQ